MQRGFIFLLGWLLSASPAVAVDINGQLRRAQLEKQANDPTGTEARIYWNTTSKAAKIHNGTTWTSVGSGGTSPLVYQQTKTPIVGVGSVGNNTAGHALDTNDFTTVASKVAWWSLNDAADDSGGLSCASAACTLTASGALFTGAATNVNIFGAANSTVYCDGNDYLYRASETFLNPGTSGSYAVGGWFAAADWTPAAEAQLVSKYYGTGNQRSWQLTLATTGAIGFEGSTDGATGTVVGATMSAPTTEWAAGSWHHVAGVYDESTGSLNLYVDGRFVASRAFTGSFASTGALMVCAAGTNAAAANYFTGRVQELFFHNPASGAAGAALTAADIRKLYSRRLDHNLNVAVENQLWNSHWYRSDSAQASPMTTAWVSHLTSTSLYYDFSDVAAGAYVDFAMQDLAASGGVISLQSYESGWLTATPGTTIAHGLGVVPGSVSIEYESSGVAGQVRTLDAGSFCDWDNTNLYCSWTGLPTVSAGNRIRLKAAVAQSTVSVAEASSVQRGTVTTSTPTEATSACAKSAAYTVTAQDGCAILLVTTSGADLTMTLPAASAVPGRSITITKIAGSDRVNIDPNASETIDGDATNLPLIGTPDSVTIMSTGTAWYTVGANWASGTYVPATTLGANCAAGTNSLTTYIRLNRYEVYVSGVYSFDPTAADTSTACDLSLPMASNLAVLGDLSGSGTGDSGVATEPNPNARIYAETAGNRARFDFISNELNNRTWTFQFRYKLL